MRIQGQKLTQHLAIAGEHTVMEHVHVQEQNVMKRTHIQAIQEEQQHVLLRQYVEHVELPMVS